jgi:hypothetical protein
METNLFSVCHIDYKTSSRILTEELNLSDDFDVSFDAGYVHRRQPRCTIQILPQ